jgi:YD repeat-containing protein
MSASSVNHVSVSANDLDESVKFYEDVLGLERVATPKFAFPVQWMRLGGQQLHLFVRENVDAPMFHHVGLNVDDFEALFWRARKEGLNDESAFFSGMYELPDGAVQMYLRDPAGNLVEIDWPDSTTLDARIRGELVPLSSTVPQTSESMTATLFLDRRSEIAGVNRDGR